MEFIVLILSVAVYCDISAGFKVSSIEPGPVAVEEGGSFQLLCKADYYYEYCSFTNPMGEICNFEWRRREWNITMKACQTMSRDVTFIGSYNEFECSIEVKNAKYEYLGVWKCQMEQYVFGGSRGSGLRGESRFLVHTPTTTTTTTSTRAPVTQRTGRKLETGEEDEILETDIVLDVTLVDGAKDAVSNLKTKILDKIMSTNMISGGVALLVMIIFLSIFAYVVHRHRSHVRDTDEESRVKEIPEVKLPRLPTKKPSKKVCNLIQEAPERPGEGSRVSRIPDTCSQPKIQWGSPQLRNKIPLSPPSMLSTCSSNRSSRRTSLTSIVPSIIEEDNNVDTEFMMKIFPHLLAMSPEEQHRADFITQTSQVSGNSFDSSRNKTPPPAQV